MGTIRGGTISDEVTLHPSIDLKNVPASVAAVAANVETTVLNYVVPVGKFFFLKGWNATGTSDGIYKLKVASVIQETYRTAWTDRVARMSFDQNGLRVSAGVAIKITVEHSETNAQDFVANIFGQERSS